MRKPTSSTIVFALLTMVCNMGLAEQYVNFHEDWDGMTVGNLDGQDGWESLHATYQMKVVLSGSDNLIQGYNSSYWGDVKKTNAIAWPSGGTVKRVVISAIRRMEEGNWHQLQVLDASGDVILNFGTGTGYNYYLETDAGTALSIPDPATGDDALINNSHKYYDARFTVDFTAANPTATWEMRNQGGDNLFSVITNSVDLELTEAHKDPRTWVGLRLYCRKNSDNFDEITITSELDNYLSVTDGLDVWLDGLNVDGHANQTVTNGQTVNTWVNKAAGSAAGNAVKAQNTTKGGTFRSAVAADKLRDAIELDGLDDALQFAEFMETNLTMYVVAKCTNTAAAANDRTLFLDWSKNGGMAFITLKTATGYLGLRDNDSKTFDLATGSQLFDNEWARGVVVHSSSGDDCTIEVGEVGATSTLTETGAYSPHSRLPTGYDNTGPIIGKTFLKVNGNEAHQFGGQIAEFLIYDHALSAADRRSVEDYLFKKYWVSGTVVMIK